MSSREEAVAEKLMGKITKTIYISQEQADYFEKLLEKEQLDDDDPMDDIPFDMDVKIAENVYISVQVCTGQTNAWVGATLVVNGREIEDITGDDSLVGEYVFSPDGFATITLNIEVKG